MTTAKPRPQRLTKFEWMALIRAIDCWEVTFIDGHDDDPRADRRKAERQQAAMNRALSKTRP